MLLPSGKELESIEDAVNIDDLEITLTLSNSENFGKNILGTPHQIPLLSVDETESLLNDKILQTFSSDGRNDK